jgi:hypothetical protein
LATGLAIAALVLVVLVLARVELLRRARAGDAEGEQVFRSELADGLGGLSGQMAAIGDQMGEVADAAYEAMSESRTILSASRTRPELTPQERSELQASWTALVCPHCGTAHWGLCPRVAKQTTHVRAGASTVSIEFWPNDQWSPPTNSFTVDDVWGGPVPTRTGEQDGKGAEPEGSAEQS